MREQHLFFLVGLEGSFDEASGADVVVWVGDDDGLPLKGEACLANRQHIGCTQRTPPLSVYPFRLYILEGSTHSQRTSEPQVLYRQDEGTQLLAGT